MPTIKVIRMRNASTLRPASRRGVNARPWTARRLARVAALHAEAERLCGVARARG